jgi:hypothetical protein
VRVRSSALLFSHDLQDLRSGRDFPASAPRPLYTNRGMHRGSRLRFAGVCDGGTHAEACLLGVRFLLYLAQKLPGGQDTGQVAPLAVFDGTIREVEQVAVD